MTIKLIPWPLLSIFSFLLLSFYINNVLACVDVLFVLDNRTMEISRNRALQVARQLPEDQKIRKWVVLSRNDRYVPRVLRNNAELQSMLSTINGDYDRFLEVATGEISRRTKTFQPFVILLFSETPVNQTLTNMWRSISLAPALHIFRIGTHQRTKLVSMDDEQNPDTKALMFHRMISEDQETDFEKLIECGRNKTFLESLGASSKFSGAHNEIRRAPTSTHRPLTSTRDPYVRRLTFYDASRTLLEEKETMKELKKKTTSSPQSKFTITRTFKKMSTKALSTTTQTPRRVTTPSKKVDYKKVSREPTTNKWRPTARTTTPKPFDRVPEAQRFGGGQSQFLTRKPMKTKEEFRRQVTTRSTTRKPYTTTRRWYIPYEPKRTTQIPRPQLNSLRKSQSQNNGLRVPSPTTRKPETTTRRSVQNPQLSNFERFTKVSTTTRATFRTTKRWFVPYEPNRMFKTSSTTKKPTTTVRWSSAHQSTRSFWNQALSTARPRTATAKWFVPFAAPRGLQTSSLRQPGGTSRATTSRPWWLTTTTQRPPRSTTARWFVPFGASRSSTQIPRPQLSMVNRLPNQRPSWQTSTTRKPPSTTARWFVPYDPKRTGRPVSVKATTSRPSWHTTSRPTTARWFVPYEPQSRQSISREITTRPIPQNPRVPSTTARWFVPYDRSVSRVSSTSSNSHKKWSQGATRKPDATFWHPTGSSISMTTPSPQPPSTIDLPPSKPAVEPMDLLVRSNSVQFAMTQEPPLTTMMDVMKFFSTTRASTTTSNQPIDYNCAADVFFLVDLSQGTGDKSQMYLDIAASAISSLPISQQKVRVGLISYSGPGRTHVRVYLDKHDDKEKLIEEMFLMERHGGTTRTADAIRFATKIFEGRAHPARKSVKRVLVVFTDGYSQDNPRDAARSARSRGLTLLAVAVKDKAAPPDQEQLEAIGGQSSNVFISPSGRELRDKIIGTQCRL